MKDTSLDAFYDLKKKNKLQAQQSKILSVMKPHVTYTRRQLAKLTKIETSTVSARVNSMLDMQIEVVGKVKDPITNVMVEGLQIKIFDLFNQ